MKTTLLIATFAGALLLGGCSGNPPVTAADEQGFKHPSKNAPPGFTTPPPTNAPPPAAATAGG